MGRFSQAGAHDMTGCWHLGGGLAQLTTAVGVQVLQDRGETGRSVKGQGCGLYLWIASCCRAEERQVG